ncbi:MAG: DMT family transporter [Gammaproteobacteria bacterium]|nr:DMT family transporter [Gammaproteobacteria bacterium]MDH3447618.1 DMT family transporter [Gammaproteobacteria bacterium]MDH3546891.1 DMT family transporter [Gammaproteobacteria bacterium]
MPSQALLLRVAPLLFVSLWSTGFVAAKYSMQNADPFVFLCLRFSITALALVPILLLVGAALPRRIWSFRHDMITGVLLHCGYLGYLFWPIKNGVPSGIVAIIIGIQPILTMTLATLYIGEHLDFRKAAGLLIGFVGISVVIIGKYGITLGLGGGLTLIDFGMCLVSLLSMAVGVFYQKKFCDQSRLLPGTLMQYVAGALATAGFALLWGESWTINWTPTFAIALTWQVLGLSIGAVVLLMYIIRNGEAGRVSSMFYLVPPLVVIEAHFLFGETLGPLSIGGMLLCVIGVYVVSRSVKA